ncbi:MAG: hypothetical protein ACLS58_09265 [Sutterella wadsworthensis]
MMTDFDIASHVVLAQGLSSGEDLRAWAQAALPGMPEGLPDAPLAFTKRLPMMKARRMSPGARLACEAALARARARRRPGSSRAATARP